MSERSKYKHLTQNKRWRQLRLQIIARDNYTCQKCHTLHNRLHVHHIIPLSVDPDKCYDPENLQTLCVECHKETHQRTDNTHKWEFKRLFDEVYQKVNNKLDDI